LVIAPARTDDARLALLSGMPWTWRSRRSGRGRFLPTGPPPKPRTGTA